MVKMGEGPEKWNPPQDRRLDAADDLRECLAIATCYVFDLERDVGDEIHEKRTERPVAVLSATGSRCDGAPHEFCVVEF